MKIVVSSYEWLVARRRMLAAMVLIMATVTVGWHVVFGANGLAAYADKRAQYRALNSEIQDLQSENQRLKQQVESLKSDPKAIEKEAREQLRYARPGETIYVLPEQRTVKPASVSAEKK